MPPQNLRLVPSFFHETERSQGRFFIDYRISQALVHIIIGSVISR